MNAGPIEGSRRACVESIAHTPYSVEDRGCVLATIYSHQETLYPSESGYEARRIPRVQLVKNR